MLQYFDTLQDESGNALQAATVAVTAYPGGGAAPIYSSNGTAAPIAGSVVTTDVTGQVSFFAPDGAYILTYANSGTVYKIKSPVQFIDPMSFVAVNDSGLANAYVVTDSRFPLSLYAGIKLEMKALNANTAASTLNLNTTGAQPINYPGGAALNGGQIQANGLYRLEWDGTQWQLMQSQSPPYYATTAAEIAAGVTPSNTTYPEGNILRYGAATTLADNSTAINSALLVSSKGGNAAFIPGGTFKITSPVTCWAGSSMYGVGNGSVIAPANTVDGLHFTVSDSGLTPQARFFRDFQVLGTTVANANAAHGIYVNAAGVIASFTNVTVQNFLYGIYINGLYDSTLQNCFVFNCYNGIYFQNQSVNVWLLDNIVQLVGSITGAGNSQGISVQGSPEVEGLHIQGGTVYGFAFNLTFGLCFEVQIEHVDVSFATLCGIALASTLGGFVIRDCWIELGATSGSFAAGGSMCGIYVAAITPSVNSKVHIVGNYINADNPIAGSVGVYLGNGNAGLSVLDNQIIGFDMPVTGGNDTTTSGGLLTGCQIAYNTINCVANTTSTGVYSANSGGIFINSSSQDVVIGPNYVVPGTGAAATIAGSSTVTVPSQGTAGNQQFPVGTPVQCTTSLANGPQAGVTYFVKTSSGASVTLSATAAGAAIAWTGTGSIGSLVQAPLPINYNAGTAPGTTLFARGAFQLTLSDPALSGVCYWVASGKMIALTPPSLTGSAGATTMTGTGLPGFLAPVQQKNAICGIENNTAASYGMVEVSTAAALSFFINPAAGAFTNSGTKGLLNSEITYSYP